jgi:DNA-binding MarR family transcriptional regulator
VPAPSPVEVIHQSTRLRIVSVLNALPRSEALEFSRLKELLNVTDGNLGAHLATLENAGYLRIDKDFAGKKPRTRVSLTGEGRKAFAEHLAFLRDIVNGGGNG